MLQSGNAILTEAGEGQLAFVVEKKVWDLVLRHRALPCGLNYCKLEVGKKVAAFMERSGFNSMIDYCLVCNFQNSVPT